MRLCIKLHRQKPFVPLTASVVYVKFVQIPLFILHAVTRSSSIGQVLTGYSLAYCITVQTAVLGVEMDGYVSLNFNYNFKPLDYCFALWLEVKSSDNLYVDITVSAVP